jgi:hypothetical protein
MDASQVIDARAGLSPAALAALRNAEQVSLAVRDGTTAVLGAWQTANSAPRLVLIQASDRWGRQQPPAEPAPALHVRDAQRDLWWRKAIEACRRGDILAGWWWGSHCSHRTPRASAQFFSRYRAATATPPTRGRYDHHPSHGGDGLMLSAGGRATATCVATWFVD